MHLLLMTNLSEYYKIATPDLKKIITYYDDNENKSCFVYMDLQSKTNRK